MIESLDTIQKEYNNISYKRSGHGEFFSEYRHPYECVPRFRSLLFLEFLFLAKSTGVCRKPLLFSLSWDCDSCPWSWPEYLWIHRFFQADSQCGIVLKVYPRLPQLPYLVIGINLVLRMISLLKILPVKPMASFTSRWGFWFFGFFFQIYSFTVDLCRCGGFLQSFADVTAVRDWKYGCWKPGC